MTNLQIWNAVEATDPKFTKEFNRGGGFKGTAINATYLVRKATDVWGPIGIGWGYQIIEERMVEGRWLDSHTRETIHVIRLEVWYHWNNQRGQVQHFGQTTFIGENKYGIYTDEEAPKKSLTDALTKCLSMLGFAGDVHMGLFDDNKYVNDRKAEAAGNQTSEKREEVSADTMEEGRVVAETGGSALRAWFKSLPKRTQAAMTTAQKDELKNIATSADKDQAAAEQGEPKAGA